MGRGPRASPDRPALVPTEDLAELDAHHGGEIGALRDLYAGMHRTEPDPDAG